MAAEVDPQSGGKLVGEDAKDESKIEAAAVVKSEKSNPHDAKSPSGVPLFQLS